MDSMPRAIQQIRIKKQTEILATQTNREKGENQQLKNFETFLFVPFKVGVLLTLRSTQNLHVMYSCTKLGKIRLFFIGLSILSGSVERFSNAESHIFV